MNRIDGDVLVGFADFFRADAARVGAAPAKPPVKPVVKKSPVKVGPSKRAKVKRNPDVQNGAKVMADARRITANSVKTFNAAQKTLKAHVVLKKSPAMKTAIGAAVVAAKLPPKTLSPKAQQAINKHTAAVVRADKAAKDLAQKVLKARNTTRELAKKMVAQKRVITSLRTPASKKTMVHGLLTDPVLGAAVAEAFQDYYTAIGATPDPNNPGYLTDGTPDPAYGGSGAAPDPNNPGYLMDGTPDPAMAPLDGSYQDPTTLPPAPSMDTVVADMAAVGGIAYDNSKGAPPGFCGSVNYLNGKTLQGADVGAGMTDAQIAAAVFSAGLSSLAQGSTMVYGILWGTTGVPGAEGSDTTHWIEVHGKPPYGKNWWESHGGLEDTANMQSKSLSTNTPKGVPYGPLVGNPMMKDFAAMRVDSKGQMFWFPQEAPDWLTFPIKQAAALTAAAAAKALKDQQDAAQAQMAADQAQAQVAQAQQDAANALAEAQAASDQRVQESTSASEAQRLLVEQAKQEQEQNRMEMDQDKQAGDLLIEQAKQEQARQAQDQGRPRRRRAADDDVPADLLDALDPGDDTGDEENMDDGTPIPGAEMMLDEDGEGFGGDPDEPGGLE